LIVEKGRVVEAISLGKSGKEKVEEWKGCLFWFKLLSHL
jgi:hypothetical protein